jgi:hypothetical protein
MAVNLWDTLCNTMNEGGVGGRLTTLVLRLSPI